MGMRVLTVVVAAAAGAAVSIAVSRMPIAAAADKPSFKVPRTSWGDPNLEGIWDYRTITPLERRAELGDREYYTDQEIAELEGRAAKRLDEAPDTSVQTGLVHADYLTDPGRHVDESRRTSLIIEPKTGKIPPLTPEAKERQDKAAAARAAAGSVAGGRVDSYLDRPLYERCITRGLPATILPTLYNNNIRIEQSPGYVAIVHEMIHETRVVPLGGSFGHVRSYLGESRGHWEGDTLVVVTTNFNGLAGMTNVGTPGSPQGNTPTTTNMKITERFTRTGESSMDYSIHIEDPEVLTQPWTAGYPMERDPTYKFFEYACHEDNTAVRNYITTSRFERAQAAKEQKK